MTTIYNGLEYTTKSINRNFRIKVNGMVDGKKINKLVGVQGLIESIGVEMANMTHGQYIMRFWKPDIMARFTDGRIITKSPDHTKCEPGRQ